MALSKRQCHPRHYPKSPLTDSPQVAKRDPQEPSTHSLQQKSASATEVETSASRPVRRAKKRAKPRRDLNPDPNTLVVSNHGHHSAQELCESDTAFGPDFVSTSECVYCDMVTGEKWALCEGDIKEDCFDLERKEFKGGRKRAAVPEKRYQKVEEWGMAR